MADEQYFVFTYEDQLRINELLYRQGDYGLDEEEEIELKDLEQRKNEHIRREHDHVEQEQEEPQHEQERERDLQQEVENLGQELQRQDPTSPFIEISSRLLELKEQQNEDLRERCKLLEQDLQQAYSSRRRGFGRKGYKQGGRRNRSQMTLSHGHQHAWDNGTHQRDRSHMILSHRSPRTNYPKQKRSSTRDFVVEDSRRFNPYEQDESDEFYKQLPVPWNVLPSTVVNKTTDFWKLLETNMIRFDGSREGYIPFRSAFLNCVHRLNMNMSYKVMALTRSLDKTVPELQELVSMAQHTPEGYRDVICALEREFGGRDRLVQYHIAKLVKAPNIKINDKRSLQVVSRCLHNYLNTLEGYGLETEVESALLLKTVREKFPNLYLLQYNQYIRTMGLPRSVRTILNWMDSILDDIIEMTDLQYAKSASEPPRVTALEKKLPPIPVWKPKARAPVVSLSVTEPCLEELEKFKDTHTLRDTQCECGCEHPIYECPDFLKMSPVKRRQFIHSNNRCFSCLRIGHKFRDCPYEFRCRKCLRGHNTLLHPDTCTYKDHELTEVQLVSEGESQPLHVEEGIQITSCAFEEDSDTISQCSSSLPDSDVDRMDPTSTIFGYAADSPNSGEQVSLRIIPVELEASNGRRIKVNALQDDGCQEVIASEVIKKRLRTGGKVVQFDLTTLGGHQQSYCSEVLDLKVMSIDHEVIVPVQAKVIPRATFNLKPINWEEKKQLWSHLRGIKFPEFVDEEVHVILGNKHPIFHRCLTEVNGRKPDDPVARLTPLGWSVIGKIQQTSVGQVKSPLVQEDISLVRANPPLVQEDITLVRANPPLAQENTQLDHDLRSLDGNEEGTSLTQILQVMLTMLALDCLIEFNFVSLGNRCQSTLLKLLKIPDMLLNLFESWDRSHWILLSISGVNFIICLYLLLLG